MPKTPRQSTQYELHSSEKNPQNSLLTLSHLPGFQPFLCSKRVYSPKEQEKIEQEFEQIVKTGCDQRVTLRGAMMFTNFYHAISQKVTEDQFQKLYNEDTTGSREAFGITYKVFCSGTIIDYNLLLHSMIEGDGSLSNYISVKSQWYSCSKDNWRINATHPTLPSACPLVTAILMGYIPVARHLCTRATEESGLEHMQDEQGNSLLHLAIKSKSRMLFLSVFSKMGDTYDYENNENKDGFTPFELATASDDEYFLRSFKKHKKAQISSQ